MSPLNGMMNKLVRIYWNRVDEKSTILVVLIQFKLVFFLNVWSGCSAELDMFKKPFNECAQEYVSSYEEDKHCL